MSFPPAVTPRTRVRLAVLAALCRAGAAQPSICQFGGSSNVDASDDDGAFDVPTGCMSTDVVMLPFVPGFPEGTPCPDLSRCVTAVYKVDAGFVDQAGLGCVPANCSDDKLKSLLEDGRFGGEVDSISNCTLDDCNPCLAAVNETGWFWHTMSGKAAIGATMMLMAAVGLWIFSCIRARRCVACWSVPRVLQGRSRDPSVLSETTPLIDEPVPPPYFEAPLPHHAGATQPTTEAPTYDAVGAHAGHAASTAATPPATAPPTDAPPAYFPEPTPTTTGLADVGP